jgi:hypothetical protein
MLPDDIQGLLDHQATSVTTTGFRNEMAGLVKDIRSIPSPWPWRRFGAIAAGLLLLLLAVSVLAQPSRFINAVELIRLSLFPQRSESATQNGIWSAQPGDWVLYGYTDKLIGYFFQPSSVKTFADAVVYTARFPLKSTSTTMPAEKTLPQPAYEDDRTVLDCKKSLAAIVERTVYNQSGEIISHFKLGDPGSLDLSTGAPINSGSILATAQLIMCDKQLQTPLLSKQQMSETNLSYLSPTLNGNADIFYGPTKPVSNADYQFELLTVLKFQDDHAFSEIFSGNNVLGLQPSYRSLAQTLQLYCKDRKVQAPKMEYYDAEGNRASLVVPIPLKPVDVIANSPFDSLLKIACGGNVAGTYEGMNNTTYEKGGHGEQKISITVQQIGSAVNVRFQTASGGQGSGDGTITGAVVKSMRLQSTIPECPGTYDTSLKFSEETMSWSYKGRDCGGPMEGHGTAKRTKL